MVSVINSAPAGFTSLGYEKVHTTLLQRERNVVETSLQPIRDSWVDSGVSIVSNGWKDTRNCPLINVIIVPPEGAMFLKAVDCEGEVKDAQFISRILIESIKMVGSENVVQVIIDNAKNCRSAGALVEGRYEHIFWTPCTIHSLNLVMQQIGTQMEWVKQIYKKGEEIQMFVTNHQMSQSIFITFSKLEMLKTPNYKDGAAKLWDVAPECANLDATVEDLTRLTMACDDDDYMLTLGASSASGTALGSNDLELVGAEDEDDFFDNPYDSD